MCFTESDIFQLVPFTLFVWLVCHWFLSDTMGDGDVASFYSDLVGLNNKKEKQPDSPKGKEKEETEEHQEEEEQQHPLPNHTFCETCQLSIPPHHQTTHSNSAAHLMNLFAQAPSPPPFYGISECNKGYKMLKKIGWTEEKGLGKNRDGPLGPLRTQLKRDRRGLGGGKKLPKRVTHFLAYHPELEEGSYSTAGAEECPLRKGEGEKEKKRKRRGGRQARAHEKRVKALVRERDEELRRYLRR